MRSLVATLLLFTASAALAHEGSHHAAGTVKEVSAERLVVTDGHGKDVVFALTDATRFRRELKPVKREEVHAGERAVVKGRDASGTMEATVVELGAAQAH